MRKAMFMVMLVVLFMVASTIAFAQESEQKQGAMMGKEMKRRFQ